jgi:hypothetical protein
VVPGVCEVRPARRLDGRARPRRLRRRADRLAPLLAALSTAAGAAYPQCVAAVLPRLVGAGDLAAANAARISIKGPASSLGLPSAPRCSS